jgi:lipoprotein-anchoring transpeptidase ErfK/SrfK
MQRMIATALVASALGASPAYAQLMQFPPDTYRGGGNLGGGFIELLFGNGAPTPARPAALPAQPQYAGVDPATQAMRFEMNPIYRRQVVDYPGDETAGTLIIDTPKRFLYLVLEDGKALRYGIGVGRPGFTWAGVKHVSAKREWPDWHPPDEMLKRRPDLPRYMAGGPENPLGARAMYLGNTLYRIHGSNEPWTIGTQVSSGCIRMRNEDVIDLYQRVKIGTKVVVI